VALRTAPVSSAVGGPSREPASLPRERTPGVWTEKVYHDPVQQVELLLLVRARRGGRGARRGHAENAGCFAPRFLSPAARAPGSPLLPDSPLPEAEFAATSTTTPRHLLPPAQTNLPLRTNPSLVQDPAPLEIDNTGEVEFPGDRHICKKSKHIDLRYRHLCRLVAGKTAETRVVRTHKNIADDLAKLSHQVR
ncbi:MAG: hypothetical protein BJ554DRAFT_4607, partial [Olpidium bornovanus]